jgi:hypothetical protein
MSETIEAPQANESPSLGVQDIQNAVRVIDFAAEQGAFKGWQTIEQVLLVRNRLRSFVQAVVPAETQDQVGTETSTKVSETAEVEMQQG